jgi:hypothetical protein
LAQADRARKRAEDVDEIVANLTGLPDIIKVLVSKIFGHIEIKMRILGKNILEYFMAICVKKHLATLQPERPACRR